ncbi:MAG: ion transporter [Bacteroidia bacterium]|nr:ion transporter [Bacteroidia bacterium]MBT8268841.1 ion transporter [Bacteroidia bacterium]NNF82774.1 ion transporter [Flavobacteriaceae bacterium]NNK70204.1 ion transporter [Flavobacteriaceae bacterium]NNL79147.1 ion transporter [Flavobacteriaceae bacterium]
MSSNKSQKTWRDKLHEIIYEADTPIGRTFDFILLIAILASILFVMLESVEYVDNKYHEFLNVAEWVITILFTIEYIVRIVAIKKPSKYIFSFYGIIDLLSTIPKYLSLFFVGSQSLVALRALRLLRIFRILKLARYIGESTYFVRALKVSRAKILVFLSFVLILCIILGTIMYLVESGEGSGFTSIPRSVYWAIVTLTTVGYGDIAPATAVGQLIASAIMILGYSIIAIPTGIVSAEMSRSQRKEIHTNTQSCAYCLAANHRDNADYCYNCGNPLHD